MEGHDNVVKKLNEEFKIVDRAYITSDMRVFGKNTSQIFRELDIIRRKQIDLASDHVSLDSINDLPPVHSTTAKQTSNRTGNPSIQGESSSSNKSFDKKEAMLKNMMDKLDDLAQSMDRFRKISEMGYDGNNTLIKSEDIDQHE